MKLKNYFVLACVGLSIISCASIKNKITEAMSSEEQVVVDEINYARTNPQEYVKERLQPSVATSHGTYLEGLKECIELMNSMEPVPALELDENLSKACKEWIDEQGPTGESGHDKNLWDRIKKYTNYKSAGENLSYGPSSGTKIVVQLLVDEDSETRGHRKNILNGEYNKIGVSIGSHSKYGSMCVIDFANIE